MATRTIEAIFRFLDLFVLGFIGKLVITGELHQNAVTKFPPPYVGMWEMLCTWNFSPYNYKVDNISHFYC